jgi:hypothetical protein
VSFDPKRFMAKEKRIRFGLDEFEVPVRYAEGLV